LIQELKIVKKEKRCISIDKARLYLLSHGKQILYNILAKYDFNYNQIEDIWSAEQGSKVISNDSYHELYMDRAAFVLMGNENREYEFIITEPGTYDINGRIVKFLIGEKASKYGVNIPIEKVLDHNGELCFRARSKRNGDKYSPDVENGNKSLKKWITDEKLTIPQKLDLIIFENTYGEIFYVHGLRKIKTPSADEYLTIVL
jgi:hypothetical protein